MINLGGTEFRVDGNGAIGDVTVNKLDNTSKKFNFA